MPDKPTRIPNWEAIHNSEIWAEEIKPWLEELVKDALENSAPILPDSNKATLNQYHFWRGQVAAIRMVMEMPEGMIEANRMLASQEKEDEARKSAERRRRPNAIY